MCSAATPIFLLDFLHADWSAKEMCGVDTIEFWEGLMKDEHSKKFSRS
jgi:hypothetical protein